MRQCLKEFSKIKIPIIRITKSGMHTFADIIRIDYKFSHIFNFSFEIVNLKFTFNSRQTVFMAFKLFDIQKTYKYNIVEAYRKMQEQLK